MSKENQKSTEKTKSQTEKGKPLFEDLQGHKHDTASYNKLMNERKNRVGTDKK